MRFDSDITDRFDSSDIVDLSISSIYKSNQSMKKYLLVASFALLTSFAAYAKPSVIVKHGNGHKHPPHRVAKQYMPPKGKCRLWYTDRPAHRQPKIGSCKKLGKKIPRGAVLIRG